MARRAVKQSAAGRDIGSIPPIANVDRRMSTRGKFRAWCEIYERESFTMSWSGDHLDAIARIEEAVLFGALYAFAMPRGSGKTSLVRAAVRWASAHSHRFYPFIIGANISKAHDSLDSIKTFFRFSELFAEDFPEIAYPAQALGGIANRASGQTCGGESTMIEWSKDRLVLPTVPAPENHPHPRPDGRAPTSGTVIGASGLTGDGIRGSLFTTSSGESVRPDLVLLDDPQTDESASSPTQNASRERLIMGAVLGMAGPGKQISAVMPCTVIQPGDMVDRVLDRQKNPLWRGHRTKLLRSMPDNMGEWDKYREVYESCAMSEPPDFTRANEYYAAHREALDEGAEAAWDERKGEHEVSAVQHAMHLFFRDEMAFYAEYQNEPLASETSDEGFLDADGIAAKVTGIERGVVPPECSTLSAFIDVQGEALYWTVCAWQDGFGGQVIDYGAWPDQKRHYFSLRQLNVTLSQQYPGTDVNGAIYAGLLELSDQIIGHEWATAGGDVMRVAHCLVDAGWGDSTKTVYQVCRDSPHAAVLSPSFGRGIRASHQPMSEWAKEAGEQIGHDWRRRLTKNERVRHVLYDTNTWKTLVQRKLATPLGGYGSLSLYKASPARHRMFAEHCTAEPHERTAGRGREIVEWLPPIRSRDNHLYDCLVGAAVAASVAGVKASGHGQIKRGVKKRIKLSEIQKQRGAA